MTAGTLVRAGEVRMGTAAGRWLLLATILGSSLAFLDGTVVNVALPRIGEDLGATVSGLQWTVNAYALTLAGFLLLGGALGDRLGRRRVFVVGAVWFGVASLLCAIAPTIETLIAARAVQGVGGALLTPGSLALIEASFRREDRGAAVGAWTGLAGVATAIGPFAGGYLVDAATWRLIFLVNIPFVVGVVWVAARHVPESRGPAQEGRIDALGAGLAALGLAGLAYALTEGPRVGWGDPVVAGGIVAAGLAIPAFVVCEMRTRAPLVPLGIFRRRQFTAGNVVTVFVYAALSGAFFLVPVQLQQSLGYSALEAGAALIPLTVIMLLLSSRAGRVAQHIGPRLPMAVGPLVAAAGLVWLSRAAPGDAYVADVLGPVVILGLGLAITVAPLTSAVLAAAGEDVAGTASAVNNDVARIAGLLAVAVVPVAAGISGDDFLDPVALTDGFEIGLMITAALAALGGLLAAVTIRAPARPCRTEETGCPLEGPPIGARLADEAAEA